MNENIVSTIGTGVLIMGAVVLCYSLCGILLQTLKILKLNVRYRLGKIEYVDTYEIKLSRMQEMIPMYGAALLVGIIICCVGVVCALAKVPF